LAGTGWVGNNLNQIARAVNRDLKSRKPLDAILIANLLAHLRHEIWDELQTVNGEFLREVIVLKDGAGCGTLHAR
jgi:hypothetical protein